MAIRNFLIVYNWRESKMDHWRDIDRAVSDRKLTAAQARELYLEYERRYKPADGYEVVLVGADSIETLRRTHGHYFDNVDTDPFTEVLGD